MILNTFFCLILVASVAIPTQASVGGYICPWSRKKLQEVLVKSLIVQPDDFTASYYAAKAFKLLNEPIVAVLVKENCAHLQKHYKPAVTAEDNFLALSAWNYLACSGKLHTDATITNLRAVAESDKSTVSDIRFAVEALKLLAVPIPNHTKISQLIQTKLREDDSLPNLGHALHASVALNNPKLGLDRVDDIVVQADEVDGKLLQWEGGLTTTSLLITGLLRISEAKPFTRDQAEKLAAYLLTRTTVQTPKGALALIEAATALAASSVSPVSISISGAAQVTTDKPDLKIHISDILGKPLKAPPTPVVAQSATRITDDVVVLSKQPLSAGSGAVEFVLPLRLEPGQYRIALSAGPHSTTVTARVLGPVSLEWLEIGLTDTDGSSAPRLTRLQPQSKLPSVLQADGSQQLSVKYTLSRAVHQSFLRLYSENKEIIFVAEVDSNKLHKLEVNLASELGQSGVFDIELILGDSVMSNPIRWNLGKVELKLSSVSEPVVPVPRGPRPEIKHLFREADKRPAEVVSMLFTVLTLAPLALLLGLWAKIGINFGNFTMLSLPFHIGFGGILGLFTLFWLKLDMFTTCAWLIPIGGFTFLAGQKMLKQLAKEKK